MTKLSAIIAKAVFLYFVSAILPAPSVLAQQGFTVQSDILQEAREIIVHLPKHYDPESRHGYPVIYVLDPDFPDDVAMQPDDIAAQTVPDAIVIGIRNIRRSVDFLPHYYSATIGGDKVVGNGGNLLAFIKEELVAFADKNFRTNERRVFMGHSWAGQFLAYTLSQAPELFDAYIITSPAMDGRFGEKTFSALKDIVKQSADLPDFIYVSVGGDEEEGLIEAYENLTSVFEQNLPEDVTVHHEVLPGLNHDNNGQISQPEALRLYFPLP